MASPVGEPSHWHQFWRIVSALLDVFDGVFVLHVDADTLERRVDARPADEFGAEPSERALHWHPFG